MKFKTEYLKSDLLSGMVVFLVALPLCLGIAVASGAPPFAGIICGIIAGIVVGSLSGSHVSVSGPAAGLIAIVLVAITDLGYETFLVAVMIAGLIQLTLGLIKAGTISSYFPTSVIEGMLVAIGLIIIMKEIPHAVGYDKAHEGDFFSFEKGAEHNFFTEITTAISYAHPGVIIITLVSIAILIAFNKLAFLKKLKALPGALVVVVVGILINEAFISSGSSLAVGGEHLVVLPTASSVDEFFGQFSRPSFNSIANPKVWVVGLTIAIVASIETLLCLEAADKMDPMKRFSSANRELKAQGIGNMLSGFVGGLPITS
ncbi:MAG: SulP family inorganic anion transporter, partial [Flavisolibacter sp.]